VTEQAEHATTTICVDFVVDRSAGTALFTIFPFSKKSDHGFPSIWRKKAIAEIQWEGRGAIGLLH